MGSCNDLSSTLIHMMLKCWLPMMIIHMNQAVCLAEDANLQKITIYYDVIMTSVDVQAFPVTRVRSELDCAGKYAYHFLSNVIQVN